MSDNIKKSDLDQELDGIESEGCKRREKKAMQTPYIETVITIRVPESELNKQGTSFSQWAGMFVAGANEIRERVKKGGGAVSVISQRVLDGLPEDNPEPKVRKFWSYTTLSGRITVREVFNGYEITLNEEQITSGFGDGTNYVSEDDSELPPEEQERMKHDRIAADVEDSQTEILEAYSRK